MSTFKANREDTTLEIQLACARTEISRKQEHQSIASFIIDERDWLNKNNDREYRPLSKKLEQTVETTVRQGLTDAHNFFLEKIANERSISNTAYLEVTKKYDAHITHEEETC